MDESCLLQTSTEAILLDKIASSWKAHERLVKSTNIKTNSFAVKHYAAEVVYQIAGFITKNQDSFHQDLTNCLKGSNNSLLNQASFSSFKTNKQISLSHHNVEIAVLS